MVVMGEARGTPSYLSPVAMQSPRYGGCVSAFFNLFDWTSAKRFSSAKRLRASSKAERGSFRKSRSFRTDHGKTRMRYEDTVPATRSAGVVARLMGLDTLPAASPVLLQEYMKQEYKPAKTTRSLRERLFTKRAHRQYAARKGRGLAASFRCRSEEWCISPAFVDIPQAQSRFMYAVTQRQKPFLSRLPPTSLHGEQIPELSLLQARSSGRNILLQGWPLAGQHNVPRDLYHETEPYTTSCSSDRQQQSIESVGSKPTDSASSRPLLTNAKLVQGRRRGSSWHGSDDSESTIDSHRRTVKKSAAPQPSPRHRRPKLVSEPEFKHSRHRGSSRSPSDRQSSIIATEISRTSASHASAGTSQSSTAGSVSSKAPSGNRGSRAGRGPGAKPASNSNAPSKAGKTTTTTTTTAKTKSKEHPGTIERSPAMAPGKPPPVRAKGMHHPPKSDLNKPPKLQRFTEKAAASGVGSRHNQEERVDDRSKTRNNAQDMASRPVVSNSERVKHRSVDAVFPELPPDCEPKAIITVQPDVIRSALFSPDFDLTECSNGEISNSPLIDYDGLCDSGKDGAISSSPLLDCDELRDAESISVVSYPVEEIRWEDEIVETILSGRCCERSCSGPSVSSRSVTFSDEERNAADSWSSCASYNPGDCDSLSDSPVINFPVKELDVDAEVLQCQEPKSPPLKYVQKHIVEESLVLDEAAEQPSPVSVLQSPFHDETCTSESSPDSKRLEEIVIGNEECDTPLTSSNIDRIKQALLDLSTFRIHDECTTERAAAREYFKDEQSFIREVLSAASFLSTPGSSPNWHNRDSVIDPSLFDRLESEGGGALAAGGLWRCDRKLLFDCVNEAFGASSLWQWQWREAWAPELVWRLSRPRGPHLVLTVVKKIDEWRKLASYAIDALIERDMSVHSGNWRCIGPEVAEVGVEIESMLWTGILDEVVVDIVSTMQKHGTSVVELDSANPTPTYSQ